MAYKVLDCNRNLNTHRLRNNVNLSNWWTAACPFLADKCPFYVCNKNAEIF